MNRLVPFKIDNRGVRGFALVVEQGLETLLGWREYPAPVRQLLGHALAATPLLAADLGEGWRFNLQYQGATGQPLRLLVTQASDQLSLRGMAQWKGEREPQAEWDFHRLLRGGTLAVMREPRGGSTREQPGYQGVVEIAGASLAEALEIYFARSEQIQTRVRLGASLAAGAGQGSRLAGLLVQRLPEGCSDDDWVHVHHLMQTVAEAELLATEPETLLARVFAEDTVRVFEARPVTPQCRCSHAQISAMLLGLGAEEVAAILREQGRVAVGCDFCGRDWVFDAADVQALFAAEAAEAGSAGTRH
ncbi:MAG TPA: Hsp33 family molecular chaperone HslO [Nevskiaceae bacterium]|nr:Hsp33 family molecular chaperone HslO [Nevskiaceae bacterium]